MYQPGTVASTPTARTGASRRLDDAAYARNCAVGWQTNESRTPMRALAERYRAPLTAFFARRVFNASEAEDMVQEVFARLISRSCPAMIGKMEAFLFRSALNLIRDRARRNQVRLKSLKQFGAGQHVRDDRTPERFALGQEQLQIVSDALERVGEKSRTIFLLHRVEQLEYEQIAAHVGISVSAVEKHMMKVLAQLQRLRARAG